MMSERADTENVSLPDPPAANPAKDERPAAEDTSEESVAVTDARTNAVAPPGKPDGEVDTRA